MKTNVQSSILIPGDDNEKSALIVWNALKLAMEGMCNEALLAVVLHY